MKNGKFKVSFTKTRIETAQEMARMINDIAQRGAPGHSFGIHVDPYGDGHHSEIEDRPGRFFFDGDGADYIDRDSIKVEGSGVDEDFQERFKT